MLKEFMLSTLKEGFTDVTSRVENIVAESSVQEGICLVYCPHTTAGITINENADPDVVHDMLLGLSRAFPERQEFLHREGNSAAHLKASTLGSSVSIIISGGRLVLGRWQGIWYGEFDGPRERHCLVKII
ncbi:secondary thiamine-phosphate synthase enzyme YjbQ [Treponema sp.]